jgi:superfamily II DNA or RNA helicase
MTAGSCPGAGLTLTPDRLQKRALAALITYVGAGGRAVLVMPCGSGKTLVGRWLAEKVDSELAVVCVPTLALLPQTLMAWRMNGDAGWAHRAMIVGSDPGSGKVVGVDDMALPSWAREEVRASTSTSAIAAFIRRPGQGPQLIVSTYLSAPKVAAALRMSGRTADLLVCDEAHRLAGHPRSEFRAVLDERLFPALRRVMMTATPVEAAAWQDDLADTASDRLSLAGGLSLDDINNFGPVAYRASFADAVEAGRLVDYDVQVLAAPAGTDGGRSANAGAAVLAAARDGATRILTFHTRVSSALDLAAQLYGKPLPGGKKVRSLYLESAHSARERQDVLDLLATPAAGEVIVVCSARVLSEGVDVPAVDTVVFADPRTSSVDIVQATGRAMRTAPGKTRGRIVLTVDLGDDGLDEDTRFAASKWRHVWRVLRALASMDPRFKREMDRRAKTPGTPHRSGPSLTATLPDGWDTQIWMLRALDRAGAAWWARLRDLQRFAERNGHAHPIFRTDPQLATWVTNQRAMYRDSALDDERIRALEALPGWVWSGNDRAWWAGREAWRHWSTTPAARQAGDGPARWAALAAAPGKPPGTTRSRYKTLAEFAVETCLRRRRGDLPANLERAADQLPGWRWDLLPADDAAMVDALAEYAAWKKTMNVPHDYLHDDGLRLGAWLTSVRRRRYTGRIGLPLQIALDMLAASFVGQAIEQLDWDHGGTGWRLGYLALLQFQAREHTCRVPYMHVETLPDFELNLSRWCVVQRQQNRLGRLSPQRAAALDRVPGWQWEVELRPGYRAVLDGVEHGTRTAYAKGCRCGDCTDSNGIYAAELEHDGTDLVDSARARAHVRKLRAQGGSQKAIARAAGVNVKTIDQLEQDIVLPPDRENARAAKRVRTGLTRVRPETERAILALTIAQVRPFMTGNAGGGRLTEPAAPVLALVDEMVALGWPKAWIARQIGTGQGRAMRVGRSGAISLTNARRIRELRQRVGSMTPPRLWRQELPPLEKILADRQPPAAGQRAS